MSDRLFGTDGVRGVAGTQLTAELALRLGRAVTRLAQAQQPRVLLIRDTRESGEMLQAALAAGVSSAGGEVLLGGVLPTPAAPLLLSRYGFDVAAVISASHNPYADNGIKLFGPDGFKLSDAVEQGIEAELKGEAELNGASDAGGVSAETSAKAPAESSAKASAESSAKASAERSAKASAERSAKASVERSAKASAASNGSAPAIGRIRELRGAREDYVRELHLRFAELSLDGMRIALDCANGATYAVAPDIFRRLGAEVTAIAVQPDGRNINDGCGSTHLQGLIKLMQAGEHSVGFAFDGDGDRVLAVDRAGTVIDGDELLALAAIDLQRRGLLGGGVAVTVMTNYGFHTAMQEAKIDVVTTSVGDRYVLEELRAKGWKLGGEQSGHIIELGFNSSGDGIAAALLTLEALGGADLAEREAMRRLPQSLVNVRVPVDAGLRGAELAAAEAVTQETARVEQELMGRGRVLVRPSGTEPLVRVMVEAPSEQEAEELCKRLVSAIEAQLSRSAD
ncbi:MAG TPA: phosphoglucosamine mutase [Solirubrobacteraceae bacterium]|jgi:phosphoglucosamine mutase